MVTGMTGITTLFMKIFDALAISVGTYNGLYYDPAVITIHGPILQPQYIAMRVRTTPRNHPNETGTQSLNSQFTSLDGRSIRWSHYYVTSSDRCPYLVNIHRYCNGQVISLPITAGTIVTAATTRCVQILTVMLMISSMLPILRGKFKSPER